MNVSALNAAAQAIRIRFGHIPMPAADCAEVAVSAYLAELKRQGQCGTDPHAPCTCRRFCGDTPEDEGGTCKGLPYGGGR